MNGVVRLFGMLLVKFQRVLCSTTTHPTTSRAILLLEQRLANISDRLEFAIEAFLPSVGKPKDHAIRQHVHRVLPESARRPQNGDEQRLQQICDPLSRTAGVPSPQLIIENGPGEPWVARFDPNLWQIQFNAAYLGQYDENGIRWVMLHELAHASVFLSGLHDQMDPHGPVFQKRARELGVS